MPEKIRAAVTSKGITPEEHNLQNNRGRTSNVASKDPLPNVAVDQANESYANGMAVMDQLDEEALKEVTSENDLKMFKDAWAKAIQANEEVRIVLVFSWNMYMYLFSCPGLHAEGGHATP